MPTNIIIFIVYTGLSFVITNKKAGTTSLLTSFLPVCRGVEADRQETITTHLLLPDTPSDVSIMRTDFHSLAIDHTCVSLDLDFSCRLNFYIKSDLK